MRITHSIVRTLLSTIPQLANKRCSFVDSIENLSSNLAKWNVWSVVGLCRWKEVRNSTHKYAERKTTILAWETFSSVEMVCTKQVFDKFTIITAVVRAAVFNVVLMIDTGNRKHTSELLNFQLISLRTWANKMILVDSYLRKASSTFDNESSWLVRCLL